MNANVWRNCVLVLLILASARVTRGESAREAVQQGNRLFGDSKYTDAINRYNEALIEQPQALEPKFNKANGYYRMDDLGEAMDLYREVAADSKDMALVAKAKYNLGNCFFQRGSRQRDSDLQKALDDMKTSITYWRQVLDIDPKNEKAAKNIEVARLTIKDIMDQLKKQQGQQNQQDQQNQQQQGQQNQSQPQNQNDPNQPQDPNQAKQQQPEQEQEQQQQEQRMAPDATAQEILDKEQQQKKDREYLQRAQYQQVDKDW